MMRQGMRNLVGADIYALTGEEYALGRSNIEVVQLLVAAGIKVIQYREKEKKMGEQYRECLAIRQITRDAGVTFIVNDHVDLAMLVEADGIHLGQDDLPPEQVRSLVGSKMIIGLSTHSPEQGLAAVQAGVDYIGVGPIYTTQTKKDVCAPVGLEYLNFVVKNLNIPFVAIGGIKEHHVPTLRQHGAKCLAMVTELVGAPDIVEKVKSIRESIEKSQSTKHKSKI